MRLIMMKSAVAMSVNKAVNAIFCSDKDYGHQY